MPVECIIANHVIVNPTWRCQLKCSYCWLPYVPLNRGKERTAEEWIKALDKALPDGGVVDFSGGEPLLYPGIIDIIVALGEMGIFWGITTNGLNGKAIDNLIEREPKGCGVITLSDHQGNEKAWANYDKLAQTAYPVKINRVSDGEEQNRVNIVDYQDWEHGKATDGKRRLCSAGMHHWAVDPTGEVYRCLVALQTGQPSLGNMIDGTFEPLKRRKGCDFGCSTCYRDSPATWVIEMEEWS